MSNEIEWTAGQTVIKRGWGTLRGRRSIHKVERVTPSGLPCVDGRLYRKNGNERGGTGWSGYSIEPATPERIAEVRADNELRRLRTRGLELVDIARRGAGEAVTADQWRAVIAALEGIDQ